MKKLNYPNLSAEMARHGETQRDLATFLGKEYGAIWRRMTGQVEWSIGEIEKICKHYNKNYYELFTKEGK